MSNLENFNNIYANLSESSYSRRPKNFPPKSNSSKEQFFDFSKDYINTETKLIEIKGGTNLPNDGIVYLQPDPTIKTSVTPKTYQTPQMNGGYEAIQYDETVTQKGLLTDDKAGFNAYFVTDTPKLSKDTKQTYLAIRGSDAAGMDTLNDWIANDANFALTNSYIPQAKLANKAIAEKIKEINKYADPNAKLDITGHSLGTMVSAQAVAQLYHAEHKAFETIGEVVLFDGPDVSQSLKNMGLSDKEIKAVGEKVTYYVNPFDMVSMLNRTAPYEEQFGTVNVIVPLRFNTTFDITSSHDFGEFQISASGKPLSASKTFHPEMLTAGHKLAKLLDTTISKVEGTGIKGITTGVILTALSGGVGALMALGISAVDAKAIYDGFNQSYKDIIARAKKKSKAWNVEHIPDYQKRIQCTSGSQKVELRAELLQSVAQDAMLQSEEFVSEVKTIIASALEDVQKEIIQGVQAANNVAQYLDYWEVNALLSEFNISNFWDTGIENSTNIAAEAFQTEIEEFSATLMKVSQNIEEVDRQGASGFNNLMTETQVNWGK